MSVNHWSSVFQMIVRIAVFLTLFCFPAFAVEYKSYEPWGDGYLLEVTPKSADELEIVVSGGTSKTRHFVPFMELQDDKATSLLPQKMSEVLA